MNPYNELDIPENATDEEIKQAFKKKAKSTHPDAGGDADEFTKINNAYMILSDPQKREYYDKYGDEKPPEQNPTIQAEIMIKDMIAQIIEKHSAEDIIYINIIDQMTQAVKKNHSQVLKAIEKEKEALNKTSKLQETILKRLSVKTNKHNFFEKVLKDKKQYSNMMLDRLNVQKTIIETGLEMINSYEFSFDEKPVDPLSNLTTNNINRNNHSWWKIQ
jgi:curved DNA-binding protein CbpA